MRTVISTIQSKLLSFVISIWIHQRKFTLQLCERSFIVVVYFGTSILSVCSPNVLTQVRPITLVTYYRACRLVEDKVSSFARSGIKPGYPLIYIYLYSMPNSPKLCHFFSCAWGCIYNTYLKQKSSLTAVEYFYHSIPGGIVKHIPLTIIPPEGKLQVSKV